MVDALADIFTMADKWIVDGVCRDLDFRAGAYAEDLARNDAEHYRGMLRQGFAADVRPAALPTPARDRPAP